ncbi:DUF6663 family protein [Halobaculum sp. D14]|uniref:DUF6663 family protein n=1 Tax=Halobaculum sp. D14 TaxID=3421642 RepID=UPI003EB71FDE
METTDADRYRVLRVDDDAVVLVDLSPADDPVDAYEPVRVAAGDADDELEPGNVVEAALDWSGDDPRFASLNVVRRSRYWFADGVENMFEAATDAWSDARAAGDAMTSRVTHNTDGEPNGALYVFADPGGEPESPVRRAAGPSGGGRDLYAEFRDGTTPIDPLVERVNDADESASESPPRDVFVLRPASGPFVVVYVAFEQDGLLSRTVRDTYF